MKLTARTLFAGILSLVVAGAVLYGIILAGSPSEERDRQFDSQRLNHLQQIAGAVDAHYQLTKSLPPSFEELAATGQYYIESVGDPKTREPYEYRTTSESAYELCATFAFDSEDQPTSPYLTKPFAVSEGLWKHPAGRHCFTLNAKKQEAGQTCDIYRACVQGQTCAKLPGRAEAVCVVAGQECAAAGCPGSCQLLESYPVQVRCAEAAFQNVTGACSLWRETKTGKVDCFGCAAPESVRDRPADDDVRIVATRCKNAPAGWQPYSAPNEPGYVGIPYGCFETDDGQCALAQ